MFSVLDPLVSLRIFAFTPKTVLSARRIATLQSCITVTPFTITESVVVLSTLTTVEMFPEGLDRV